MLRGRQGAAGKERKGEAMRMGRRRKEGENVNATERKRNSNLG